MASEKRKTAHITTLLSQRNALQTQLNKINESIETYDPNYPQLKDIDYGDCRKKTIKYGIITAIAFVLGVGFALFVVVAIIFAILTAKNGFELYKLVNEKNQQLASNKEDHEKDVQKAEELKRSLDSQWQEIESWLAAEKAKAVAGDANAQYELAAFAIADGDFDTAFLFIKSSAEQGDASAQSMLGSFYLNGWGTARNQAEAEKWLRIAADAGIAEAQFDLAQNFDLDTETKKRFMLAAGEAGIGDAQAILGSFFENGMNFERDPQEAFRWYLRAANNEQMVAQWKVANSYYNGDLTSQDFAQAKAWAEKAAEKGYPNAQELLCVLYYFGNGVAKNTDKVLEYGEAALNNERKWFIGTEQKNCL